METRQQNTSCSQEKRHYIIVVHGMGEQKINVTAPPVVERFAEARHKTSDSFTSEKQWFKRKKSPSFTLPHYNFIIPANLSEQSVRNDGIGHGWSEFEGIPVSKVSDPPKFNGAISIDPNTNNFRFVDVAWQFILKEDMETFGSSTEEWSKALLEKIVFREKNEKCHQNEKPHSLSDKPLPSWALPMLKSIVNTAIPVKKMLAFKYADVTKYIFDGYLGDVHLYGDYGRTRGRAVRHFHVILDEIMIRDFTQWYWGKSKQEYQPPEFTIIAHSLGSIMSFDALVYAHVKDDIRRAEKDKNNHCPSSLPFPGYCDVDENEIQNWDYLHQKLREIWEAEQENPAIIEIIKGLISPRHVSIEEYFDLSKFSESNNNSAPEIPCLSWRNHVKNFITIGSPIDKFLTLWPDNYTHLNYVFPGGNNEEDSVFLKEEKKINHFNFCDEQDPVGHHLEEAMKSPLYNVFFNATPAGNHDVVFRRYSIPGAAHLSYFTDQDLFSGIIDNIIDTNTANTSTNFVWEDLLETKGAYRAARRWAYYLIPFIAALVTTALLSYALMGESALWRFICPIAAVLFWIQPNLIAAYQDEASDIRLMNKSWLKNKLNKIKLVRGILSRLVSAAIEWRRILIIESLGSNTKNKKTNTYNIDERIAFQSNDMNSKPLWQFARFIGVFILYLILSALILDASYLVSTPVNNFPPNHETIKEVSDYILSHQYSILLSLLLDNYGWVMKTAKITFIFTLTSALVRLYVAVTFIKVWWQCQKNHR